MKTKTPSEVAAALKEYQLWRRGEGKYDFDPDNGKDEHAGCPFTPKELGDVEDLAIAYLEKMQEVIVFYRKALEDIRSACDKPFGKDARKAKRFAIEALENGIRVRAS